MCFQSLLEEPGKSFLESRTWLGLDVDFDREEIFPENSFSKGYSEMR